METATTQLWIIIGLLGGILGMQIFSVFCYGERKKEKERQEHGPFASLWYRGEWDRLIAQAKTTLDFQPNLPDALYFGGKALLAKGRYAEAEGYFKRLLQAEPSFESKLRDNLVIIERELASNNSLNSDAR
nr:hypothetical protein 8 [Gammaproteobacteria bacterium]